MSYLHDLTVPPLLIQSAVVAGLFGFLGVMITRSVAAAQLRVQEQTLFASMLPRRIEWLDKFRKAVDAWEEQMQEAIANPSTAPAKTKLGKVKRLAGEARWLFGGDVAHEAQKIVSWLETLRTLRIQASEGNRDAADQVGYTVTKLREMFEPLQEAASPFINVSHITNPEAKKKRRKSNGDVGKAVLSKDKPDAAAEAV